MILSLIRDIQIREKTIFLKLFVQLSKKKISK